MDQTEGEKGIFSVRNLKNMQFCQVDYRKTLSNYGKVMDLYGVWMQK